MAHQFSMSDVEQASVEAWVEEHRQTCRPYAGAIGGAISYEFTPTGLGVLVRVKCMCGANSDCTDTDGW